MWIELHDTLSEHRKTEALAQALGINQAWAVGILASLWTWALRNAPEGDLGGASDKAIARACFWTRSPARLVDALTACGWLEAGKIIHDWQDYAGRLMAKRQQNAQRMRTYRARTQDEPWAATVPNQASPNRTPENPTDTHALFPDQAWRSSVRARGAVAQRVVQVLEGRGCKGGSLHQVVMEYLALGLAPERMIGCQDMTDGQLSAALFAMCREAGLAIEGEGT